MGVLDLILLVAVIAFVFGVGSAFLIFGGHARRDALRHPWPWFRATYTWRRWLTNPLKLSLVGLLWQTNFQQLALSGPAPSIGEVNYDARLYLVLANLLGGCVCFYALHLREFEMSLWIELSSYISLIGTLGMWVYLVYMTVEIPNTSYGLNLIEGFIIGSVIRAALILRYKRALNRDDDRKTARLRLILGGDVG